MTRAIVGALLAAGVAVGCSNQPRPIVEARPLQSNNTDKPVDLPSGPPPEKSDPAAVALVAAAVDAHTGGKPELLDQLRTFDLAREGNLFGQPESLKWRFRGRWPDHFRLDDESETGTKMVLCRTGDTGWQAAMSPTGVMVRHPFTAQRTKEVLPDSTYEWLSVLAPLRDTTLVAAPAAGREVGGKPADGVWLTGKGIPSAVVHFDRETHRLVRFSYAGIEGGGPVIKEVTVNGTRDVNGVVLPDKLSIRWDGRVAIEWTVGRVQFPVDFPAKTFEEP